MIKAQGLEILKPMLNLMINKLKDGKGKLDLATVNAQSTNDSQHGTHRTAASFVQVDSMVQFGNRNPQSIRTLVYDVNSKVSNLKSVARQNLFSKIKNVYAGCRYLFWEQDINYVNK